MRFLLLVLFAFPMLTSTSSAQDWSNLESRYQNVANQLSGLLSSLASSTSSAQQALDDLTTRKNAAALEHPECFAAIQYAQEAVANLETGISEAQDGSGFSPPGQGFQSLYDEAYEYESTTLCDLFSAISGGGNQTVYDYLSDALTSFEDTIALLQEELDAKMEIWGPASTAIINEATSAVEALESGC
ncbi:MAG: hypothetical protein NTY42_04345 [Planctomycetota bacterium]|nr:hypothetical protein [Planctomycetota bacterium]